MFNERDSRRSGRSHSFIAGYERRLNVMREDFALHGLCTFGRGTQWVQRSLRSAYQR